jgi:hypothetical protein
MARSISGCATLIFSAGGSRYPSLARKSALEKVMNATAAKGAKVEGKPGDNKLTPQIVREPLRSIKKKLPSGAWDSSKHFREQGADGSIHLYDTRRRDQH